MKKVLLSSVMLLLSILSFSQLVLTNQNFIWDTENLTADYLYRQSSGISLPLLGENQTWDYSNLVSNNFSSREFVENTNTEMPLSEYYYVFTNYIGSYLSYTKERYLFIDETGWMVEGVVTRSAYCNISSITGNQGDNIIFPADTFIYHKPGYLLAFPTEYGNNHIDTMITETEFNLTAQDLEYNNVPCLQKQYLITNDLVTGTGTIKVPSTNNPNTSYEVIQIKRITTTIDSFFVQGEPASSTLLSYFGLNQGQVKNSYDYYFYRENTHNYIFRIACNTNFSSVILALWDEKLRTVNTAEHFIDNDFLIYPNPTSGIITIDNENSIIKNIEIISITGQLILTQLTENRTRIDLDLSSLNSGIYFVKINSKNGVFVEKIVKD